MKDKLKGLILGLVLVLGLNYAGAAWSDPGSAPTAGNPDVPVNVGSTEQTKDANLNVNGIVNGYYGLFTGTGANSGPSLISTGEIKIGSTNILCNAANAGNAGSIRYNSGVIEYCGGPGPSWLVLPSVPSCPDGKVLTANGTTYQCVSSPGPTGSLCGWANHDGSGGCINYVYCGGQPVCSSFSGSGTQGNCPSGYTLYLYGSSYAWCVKSI